ncbi:alternative ribosome rescue factor ArfA [Sphingosinicella sp. BN140058]|uniref:alternative ribosome rescue factor ArfA n=1 Tax=Sphingosinicella sp. BN140058 TaxID=1892855 RepID=UPI0013EBB187|nr:alternative ribosome rescue factor ArfA [Sphingosinicella sp. BN140058]
MTIKIAPQDVSRRMAFAATTSTDGYTRVVRPRKGKGSFSRKPKHGARAFD